MRVAGAAKAAVVAATGALLLAAPACGAGRRVKAATGGAPATLDGVWTNASYTQFERPDGLKALVLTPEQAGAFEAKLAKTQGINIPPEKDELGQVESEFNEAGTRLARIRGQIRSSWLVTPADGQVHYTDAGKRLLHRGPYRRESVVAGPEDAGASTRCLQGNGSAPPFMSSMDTNLLQIVQTADRVGFYAEQDHDVRTVRLGPRPANEPASWSGNSYGRWEGRTLVVETEGFRDPVVDRFWFTFSGKAKVIERFTRSSESEILYTFTLIDPDILVEPLQGEMVFEKAKGRIFEYACHEGNYALPGILRAALVPANAPRAAPAEAAAKP